MEYFENAKGEVIGRLYECGSGFVGEIGRYSKKAFVPFLATKSARFKTYRKAEKFLYDNGCAVPATA